MITSQGCLQFWDMLWWGIGRFFGAAFITIAVLFIVFWIFENVLKPICEAIKSAWWRWTKRCPNCERSSNGK